MPKAKTLRKRRFMKNALARTAASWKGAALVLSLVARSEGSDIVTGEEGVRHLQVVSGGAF